MSVANEFDCKNILESKENKVLYMVGLGHDKYTFTYHISCKPDMDLINLRFFFNMKTNQMLLIHKTEGFFRCVAMRFWLENEQPVPAVKYMMDQERIISLIHDSFKEQYAAIIIDDAINS